MLRVSAKTTETDIDIQGIAGNADSAARGIEFGAQLMAFAESVAMRDQQALKASRQALLEAAGPAVLIDAAGVAANFQRMVRIADATGIPYDRAESGMSRQNCADLNLTAFASAKNTLRD